MDLFLGSRFAVSFFAAGVVPNPVDIRFQRVSGLSANVELGSVNEGGQNLYTHRLPRRVTYGNLVLERGFVVTSGLNVELNVTMSLFKFLPSNVMVTLLSEEGAPISGWMFIKAFPVRWQTADLNANEDRVLIDTLELAYAHMQALRI
jgi:phage tail-like protein